MTTTIASSVKTSWACPDGRLILRAAAPRSEWLAARRKGLGGSDASTVAGVNPYHSRYALWLDKTGRGTEERDKSAMEWGRRLEPVIAGWFTDTTGIPVRRAGLMQSRTRPWQLVSLDGMTADGGNTEWKTTSWRTQDADVWLDGDVPDHAEIQSQHGMAVTGRTHCHCAVLIDGRNPVHKVIERDDALIATLTDLESRFWHEHVVADSEPPVDGSEATSRALKTRYATANTRPVSAGSDVDGLIEARMAAKAAEKAAKAASEAADNQLRALLADGTDLVVLGLVKATLYQNGTFSPSRFTAENPELAEEYQSLAPTLDVGRLKTERPDLHAQYRARVLRVPTKPKPFEEH